MRSSKHSKQFVRIIWDSSVWTVVQKKHVLTKPWECPLTFPTAHQNKTSCTAFLTSLTTSPHSCRRKAQVCCVVIFSIWIPNHSDTQNKILGNGRKKCALQFRNTQRTKKERMRISPKTCREWAEKTQLPSKHQDACQRWDAHWEAMRVRGCGDVNHRIWL